MNTFDITEFLQDASDEEIAQMEEMMSQRPQKEPLDPDQPLPNGLSLTDIIDMLNVQSGLITLH